MAHYDERTPLLIPENIKLEIDVSPRLWRLLTRILDRMSSSDGTTQASIDALTKRLNQARAGLAAGLAAHPDPNPND